MAVEGEHLTFGILGDVTATRDGRTVTIRSVRKRLILAILLCHAGTTVSCDRLIDALWGAEPPPTAQDNLRVYLYKLRKDLGPGHGIEYENGGYRLRYEPGGLDADVFCDLARKGERAAARGDTVTAARLLRRALDLWRGNAYGDLADHPALRDDAHRLDEHRLAALEARIEADLALGAHTELVPELVRLVAELPFREGLRARLMLALYRDGRQAEALETYHEGRRILAEELGIAPGQVLRDMYEAILRGDPSLEPPSPPPRVRELPPDIAHFTGRCMEVARLTADLVEGRRLAVISGPAGIGKSALAVHVAHRVADRYPDGQLYLDLHGATPGVEPLRPAEALGRLLRSLGVAGAAVPADADEAAARFRSLTAGHSYLIVLDNALDAAQIRPLLPGGPACAVVVTSRKMLGSLDGAAQYPLDVLAPDEADEMFRRLAGDARVDADPSAAREVVSRCGYLPLAICIAAARLAVRPTWTVATLADRLAKEEHRLSELQNDDRTLRAGFAVSYHDLAPAAARAFRILGLLDCRDVGIQVASAATGLPPETAERVLDDLVDAQLLRACARGRYRFHDLIRLFARERAAAEEPAQARAHAVRRVLHHYLATARAASELIIPMAPWRATLGPPASDAGDGGVRLADREAVYAWIDEESGNLSAVVRQAVDSGADDLAVGLAAALFFPLYDRGRWRELLSISELGAEAADRLGDPFGQAIAHGDLGYTLADHGEHRRAVAHLQRSLAEYRALGNRRGESAQLDRLGVVYSRMGRFTEAIAHFRASLAAESGNRYGEAITLTNLGLTYQRAGMFDLAVEAHLSSIAISEDIGDLVGMAVAAGNAAEAHRRAGRPDKAVDYYRRALEADRRAGNRDTHTEAVHWWGLGGALADLGEEAAALECRRQAAAILHRLGLIGGEERARIDSGRMTETPQVIARNQ